MYNMYKYVCDVLVDHLHQHYLRITFLCYPALWKWKWFYKKIDDSVVFQCHVPHNNYIIARKTIF